jgi:endonuclease YncB( thermonuclease family)
LSQYQAVANGRKKKEMRMTARRMGVVVFWLLWALLGLTSAAQAASRVVWQGTVTHVTDGDTLWVRPLHEGAPRQIRLDGIDAPEICQQYGEQSRAALAARVQGQRVQVRGRHADQYGRLLARVSMQGDDVGGWMVSLGHAWSYRYRNSPGPYASLESRSKAAGRGLFAQANPERPRDFRKRHGSCH